MNRLPLPQNYIIKNKIVGEDYGNFGDWAMEEPPTWGSLEVDIDHAKNAQSLKINALAGQTVTAVKTVNFDLTGMGVVSLWVYIPDITHLQYIKIRFATGLVNMRGQVLMWHCAGLKVTQGWNLLSMHLKDAVPIGNGYSYTGITLMRMQIIADGTGGTSVSFSDLSFGVESLPRIMIHFDDGISTQYTVGFDYLYTQKGRMGTININPDFLDTNGYMQSAQLKTVYDAGWALGNHTKSHTRLDTMTKAAQIATLLYTTNWLIERGYTRAAHCVAYPGDAYNSDTLSVMAELGMKTGRLGAPSLETTPPGDIFKLHCLACAYGVITDPTPDITVAQVKALIDQAINAGSTLCLTFHHLAEAGHLVTLMDYLINDFKAIIDYAIARRLQFVTIDEWYNGLTNPRYRSLPLGRATV